MEVRVAGLHVNLDRSIPVVIGTVPLMMAEIPNAPPQLNQPSAPSFAEPTASAPLPYYMDPSGEFSCGLANFLKIVKEQISNNIKNG